MGICCTPDVSPLVDAFIVKTEVELMEMAVAGVPLQKWDGPLADIIAFLAALAQHKPSCKA